jgi:hypothetical protein
MKDRPWLKPLGITAAWIAFCALAYYLIDAVPVPRLDPWAKQILGVAIGCLVALAIWKETRQRIGLSIGALVVIATTIAFADRSAFPFDLLIWIGGYMLLVVGKVLFVVKPWKQAASAPESREPKTLIQVVSK